MAGLTMYGSEIEDEIRSVRELPAPRIVPHISLNESSATSLDGCQHFSAVGLVAGGQKVYQNHLICEILSEPVLADVGSNETCTAKNNNRFHRLINLTVRLRFRFQSRTRSRLS